MTEHKICNRILASRDEARLQAHLASIEAKAEFDKLDARIEAFAQKSGRKVGKLDQAGSLPRARQVSTEGAQGVRQRSQ